MKFAFVVAALMSAAVVSTASQAATVTVNPAGQSGSFSWDNGLGAIDQIDGTYAQDNVAFSLTTVGGGSVDVTLDDCCVAGDQFALFLNGTLLSATSVTGGGGSPFSYFFDDVALGDGENLFTINLTALAPGFTSGGASYAFSAVGAAAVPEPSTWAMMLFGMGAIGYSLRRRKVALPQHA